VIGWNEDIKKELAYCGENVFIGHNTIFTNPGEVFLHDNVRIDPFCLITTALDVGNYVQVCSHAVLGGGKYQKITLGNWTFIGYGSKLFTASEDYTGNWGPVNEFWGRGKVNRGNITFENYSGIASDVIVFPGVTLPEGCTVGAQSMVRKDLTPWSIYLGNPLKFHGNRNKMEVISRSNSPGFRKY
jgi:acetyltransferase-like isoleucine patch superfamily enzyme